MYRVLFIHGLGAQGDLGMAEALNEMGRGKIQFLCPDFPTSPKQVMSQIEAYLAQGDIDAVVGMSIGGFYALRSSCSRGVVINPCMTPIADLLPTFGRGTYMACDGSLFTLDETFYQELKEVIQQGDPNVDTNRWYLKLPKRKKFGGIFGGRDELFSHYDDFREFDDRLVVKLAEMGHPFDLKYINVLALFLREVLKGLSK